MVVSCSAYNCTNRHDKNRPHIRFHRFPLSRPDVCEKWITAVRRKNWKPTKHSALCSDHFLPENYEPELPGNLCKRLKSGVVPSQFAFPPHLMQPVKKRRVLQYKTEENVQKGTDTSHSNSDVQQDNDYFPTMSKTQSPSADLLYVTSSSAKKPRISSPKKVKLQKKIKVLHQKIRRRSKKIHSMKDLIMELKKKVKVSDDLVDILSNSFGGFPLELTTHLLQSAKEKKTNIYYTPIMKQFALTLYFYSSKAYKYVRSLFHLPHPSRLRAWVAKSNCEPGFLKEVFQYIEQEVKSGKPWLRDATLIIDSMSLRKQTSWDVKNSCYSGYVEVAGATNEQDTLASEALVFMLVSLKHNFKCPVAYFFVDKVSSDVQAQLLNTCLSMLHNVHVKVWAITCDGLFANLKTLKSLGCDLDNLSHTFVHPTMGEVCVFFDPCHMVKLARGCLSDKKFILSPQGDVSWQFIMELHKLQEKEGFKFANKLSSAHINWQNRKMNVQLAVQTLSSGVADAIDFLRKSGNSSFQGSEATIEFIRIIDRAFDILNSRNPHGKGFKKPLFLNNEDHWRRVFLDTMNYLTSLKLDGIKLLDSARKMFALGLLISMKSIMHIADKVLKRNDEPFKYLLSYKLSQDHLELFFSCIRSRGGWNNNPSTLQFKWALRRMLFRNSVVESGNCVNFSSTVPTILQFRDDENHAVDTQEITGNETAQEEEIINLCTHLHSVNLSEYQDNVLFYICGYLIHKLKPKISCDDCLRLLESVSPDARQPKLGGQSSFLLSVTRGGLCLPSYEVFLVVKEAEKMFRLIAIQRNLMGTKNLKRMLTVGVMKELTSWKNFPFSSHPHTNEIGWEDLHEFQLAACIDRYFVLRLQTYAKQVTLSQVHKNAASERSKLTKLVLFKNI